MIMQKGNYLSITKVAQALGTSNATIKEWYKWWEDDEYEKPDDLYLPEYVFMDKRKTKFFHINDIEKLKLFQTKINTTHRGIMAKFNQRYYGRGENEQNEQNKAE